MKKAKAFLVATSLLVAISLGGCGTSNNAAESNNQNGSPSDSQEKEYIVGTDANFAPFEYVSDKNEVVGFEIDLVKAIADKAGFKVNIVNTPWEGIFTTLKNGDRDFLVSAITITDERKKDMDFSDSYFEAKQVIVVGKDSSIANMNDLNGKKVGVLTGSTGDIVVTELLGKDSKDIKRFEGTPLSLKELENGGIEAVVADNGVVTNYTKNNPDKGLKIIEDAQFAKEYYGFAVNKGNKDVLDKINEGLNKIKTDGTYDKIYEEYFGEK